MGLVASVLEPKHIFSTSDAVSRNAPEAKSLNQRQFAEMSEMFGQAILTQRECKIEYDSYNKCAVDNNVVSPQTDAQKEKLRRVCDKQIDALNQCINDKNKWEKLMR